MRRMVCNLAAAAACLGGLASAPACAQWTAKAEAGLVAARGNTNSDSANAKFDVAREFTVWKHSLAFAGVYASDELGTTAQRWFVRGQSDYSFHSQGFWFGSSRYEDDRFSGFEYQSTYGTGFGWRFFDDPRTRLAAQLGAGYKLLQSRDSLDAGGVIVPGEREENFIAQAGVDLEHGLTETTKVINKLLVESGAENTFVRNTLSIEVKIMSSLALAAGYELLYNSNPPEGFNTTDRLTTLNLVYELK